MDDLMNKLQSVLSDEESMRQIRELADMLTAQSSQNTAESPQTQGENENQNQSAPDFSALIKGLGAGQSQQPQTQSSLPDIDISKLMQITQVIQNANKPDKNVDLLVALRPLLKEENQVKIDRLIKIFKLFAVYPALKESGLLGGDLFGII